MSRRAASWVAWSLATLCIAMFVAILVLYALLRSAPQAPSSLGTTRLTLFDLLTGVPFLAFPIV